MKGYIARKIATNMKQRPKYVRKQVSRDMQNERENRTPPTKKKPVDYSMNRKFQDAL